MRCNITCRLEMIRNTIWINTALQLFTYHLLRHKEKKSTLGNGHPWNSRVETVAFWRGVWPQHVKKLLDTTKPDIKVEPIASNTQGSVIWTSLLKKKKKLGWTLLEIAVTRPAVVERERDTFLKFLKVAQQSRKKRWTLMYKAPKLTWELCLVWQNETSLW